MLRLKFAYRIRKARVLNENDLSLIAYRKKLRDTRRNLHIEANQYQNAIEDQFLFDNSKALNQKHFDNYCFFRGFVAKRSYELHENLLKWKRQDDEYEEKLNQMLHNQELGKMNRRRIIQIMKHESEQYWINEANAEERLNAEAIFPQWLAATEYYHKLTAEALAYEALDFSMLDKIASNEDAVKEKNKVLMPLYSSLRTQIRDFKLTPLVQLDLNLKATLQKLEKQNVTPTVLQTKRQRILAKYQRKRNQLLNYEKSQAGKMEIMRSKTKQLINILKTWREYSVILGLSSVQVLKLLKDKGEHGRIEELKRKIEKAMTRQAKTQFIDSLEQDTQSHHVSLNEYLESLAEAKRKSSPQGQSSQEKELAEAIAEVSPKLEEGSLVTRKPVLDLSTYLAVIMDGSDGKPIIGSEHRDPGSTTTTVEVLKELFQKDQEMVQMLNTIGEIEVNYGALFSKIWDSVQTQQ